MVNSRLYEVGKHVLTTGPGMGTGMAGASIVYACSEESLAGLSSADRDTMMRVSRSMGAYITDLMTKTSNEAYAELAKKGVTVSHLSAAETAQLAKITPFFDEVAATLNSQGLPGTAMIKRYRELAADYLAGKPI
jgi:TRAP-type C4-dicarboxylate transport system substrate-binding protein